MVRAGGSKMGVKALIKPQIIFYVSFSRLLFFFSKIVEDGL